MRLRKHSCFPKLGDTQNTVQLFESKNPGHEVFFRKLLIIKNSTRAHCCYFPLALGKSSWNMAAKEDQELSLLELVCAKLTEAQNVMAEASDSVNAKVSDALRLMAETGTLLKKDLDHARVRKEAVEEMTRTLSHGHFASLIKLNVGGKIYKTTLDTLRKDRDSVLCAMFSGRFELKADPEDGAYFIDRDGKLFRYILNYLRDGDLLYPDDQTVREQLLKEAKFYQVQGIINHLEEAMSPALPSSIIKDEIDKSSLLSWLSPMTTFSLLYCASVDGKTPADFHRCCDKKGPTLVVISGEEYIFGGYTSKSWTSGSPERVIEDSESFLFTLVGPSKREPMRFNSGAHGGICCNGEKGPWFGTSGGYYNLEVLNNFYAKLDLISNCDFNFHDSFDVDSDFSENMLFELDELEVFKANF
ncbi:BTB/POZ domain-containing protein KCTD21 [Stylophora pistillata]|uniref:BTB/POZ domain-containing protein KCTD21 n=3 Tax=Stylophora pistillata TaxID=50429 RepID=A0A2B4SLW0_STYPI|nr:BTB/POZ domain-containing protein KCTD21 [Stylophora pistillata]